MKAAGIPVRDKPIHEKAIVVYAKYGAAYSYRAYTGSHNLSASANSRFDEIFAQLDPEAEASHPIYDAYDTHFHDAFDNGKPF